MLFNVQPCTPTSPHPALRCMIACAVAAASRPVAARSACQHAARTCKEALEGWQGAAGQLCAFHAASCSRRRLPLLQRVGLRASSCCRRVRQQLAVQRGWRRQPASCLLLVRVLRLLLPVPLPALLQLLMLLVRERHIICTIGVVVAARQHARSFQAAPSLLATRGASFRRLQPPRPPVRAGALRERLRVGRRPVGAAALAATAVWGAAAGRVQGAAPCPASAAGGSQRGGWWLRKTLSWHWSLSLGGG